MGIKSLSLIEDQAKATLTFTASEAAVYAEDGMAIANGVHVICTSDESALNRKQITFKVRPAAYDTKTNSYSKSKNGISVSKPITLANGSVSFLTARVELEAHPEATAGDVNVIVNHAAEILLDPEYSAFWQFGAKS